MGQPEQPEAEHKDERRDPLDYFDVCPRCGHSDIMGYMTWGGVWFLRCRYCFELWKIGESAPLRWTEPVVYVYLAYAAIGVGSEHELVGVFATKKLAYRAARKRMFEMIMEYQDLFRGTSQIEHYRVGWGVVASPVIGG